MMQDQIQELEQTVKNKEQILKSRILALEDQERLLEQNGVIDSFTLEQLVVDGSQFLWCSILISPFIRKN
jgi:hypothetical protein